MPGRDGGNMISWRAALAVLLFDFLVSTFILLYYHYYH